MDLVTLLACGALVEGCLAAVMAGLDPGNGKSGAKIWSASLAMRCAAFLLYLWPMAVHSQQLQVQTQFAAAALFFCSGAVSMRGTLAFLNVNAPAPRHADYMPLNLMAVAYVMAFFVFDSPRGRVAIESLGLAYGLAWSNWKIMRATIGSARARFFVVMALRLWVLVLLARALNVMTLPANASSTAVSVAALQAWFVVGYMVAVITVAAGLIGLLVSELHAQLEQARSEAMRRSNTDMLTGLMNRPAILGQAEEMFKSLHEPRTGMAALMIDCDDFTAINDRLGHFVGDMALQQLGQVFRENLPEGALAGRVGGEAFLVLLHEPLAPTAIATAEHLNHAVSQIALESGRRTAALTVSIGVALLEPDDHSLHDLLSRADAAVYHAKSEGRNRVVFNPSLWSASHH